MANETGVAPGDRFGDLTVLRPARGTTPGYGWVCECGLGHLTTVYTSHLRTGRARCRECHGARLVMRRVAR